MLHMPNGSLLTKLPWLGSLQSECLLRHLRQEDLALLFGTLVLEGSRQHCGQDNFDLLVREVPHGDESRAPSRVAIIMLAKATAQAVSTRVPLQALLGGFCVVLQGCRCTLTVL